MSTLYGAKKGNWGLTEETGLITLGARHQSRSDMDAQPDVDGDDSMLSFFNPKVEVTIDALIPQTSPITTAVASQITLQNSIVDHIDGAVTGGMTILQGVLRPLGVRAFEGFTGDVVYHPNVTSA